MRSNFTAFKKKKRKCLNSDYEKAIAKEYIQKNKVYDISIKIASNLPVIDLITPNKVGFYMVELRGFEPLASTLPVLRSPN